MSSPSEGEEEVKEVVAREREGRLGRDTALDDPRNDEAHSNFGLWALAVIVLAIVAYVLYLVFS